MNARPRRRVTATSIAAMALALTACPMPAGRCTAGDADVRRDLFATTCVTPSGAAAPTTPVREPMAKPKGAEPLPGYVGRTIDIVIRDPQRAYEPRELIVQAGDILRFTNLDPERSHTFTQDEGAWDSGPVGPGAPPYTYEVALVPGDYTFHCALIPYVLGGPIRVVRERPKDPHDVPGTGGT